jgi:hypothetical protein
MKQKVFFSRSFFSHSFVVLTRCSVCGISGLRASFFLFSSQFNRIIEAWYIIESEKQKF